MSRFLIIPIYYSVLTKEKSVARQTTPALSSTVLAGSLFLTGAEPAFAVVPGDQDGDGVITGPRLAGGTGTYHGCFVSGPKTNDELSRDRDFDRDVVTITKALVDSGSWKRDNIKEFLNKRLTEVTECVAEAQSALVKGDEFIFYFSGHGGDFSRIDTTEPGEGGGADNTFWIRGGRQNRMSDDELASLLSGFRKSVTIVVILDSCYSHTFFDGANDLPSVTQGDGTPEPAGARLALLAASTAAQPICTGGFTTKLAGGLKKEGRFLQADSMKDGIVTAKELADFAKSYVATGGTKCEPQIDCRPVPRKPESSYFGPLPPEVDNCPTVPNPDQSDSDGDGIGDACVYNLVLNDNAALPEERITATAITVDNTIDNVMFNWISPELNIVRSFVDISDPFEDSLVPNVLGTWTVEAIFKDGIVVRETLEIPFTAVPEPSR